MVFKFANSKNERQLYGLWVDGRPVQEIIFEQAENNKAIANCNGFVVIKTLSA